MLNQQLPVEIDPLIEKLRNNPTSFRTTAKLF